MFTAESASVPTSLETKIPSTIVYKDINTIMIMVGNAKRSREKIENLLQ